MLSAIYDWASRLAKHGGEFCVSVFRQNQESHIFNVHDGAYSPWSQPSRKVGAVCAPLAACMPTQPFGNAISRESACLAVGEQDFQLAEHHVPILTPGAPMLDDSLSARYREPLNKSSAVTGGSFGTTIQLVKLEIHKVCLRFPNM